jgi:hypothetical protein
LVKHVQLSMSVAPITVEVLLAGHGEQTSFASWLFHVPGWHGVQFPVKLPS